MIMVAIDSFKSTLIVKWPPVTFDLGDEALMGNVIICQGCNLGNHDTEIFILLCGKVCDLGVEAVMSVIFHTKYFHYVDKYIKTKHYVHFDGHNTWKWLHVLSCSWGFFNTLSSTNPYCNIISDCLISLNIMLRLGILGVCC